MAESARSEMDADPDPVRFIGENIDVMIASADRAELSRGSLLQLSHWRQTPGGIVKKLVVDPFLTRLADAERNVANNVIHDLFDRRGNLREGGVGSDGEISAGDVEADAGKRNLICVSNDAPDRLGIALVTVRAENAALAASGNAPLDLGDRRFIMGSEYFRRHPSFASPTTRHVSTASRDLIVAGLITAFTESNETSEKGIVRRPAIAAFSAAGNSL